MCVEFLYSEFSSLKETGAKLSRCCECFQTSYWPSLPFEQVAFGLFEIPLRIEFNDTWLIKTVDHNAERDAIPSNLRQRPMKPTYITYFDAWLFRCVHRSALELSVVQHKPCKTFVDIHSSHFRALKIILLNF